MNLPSLALVSWLRELVWIDAQAALWSVVLLLVAVPVSLALRRQLPIWRKGLWLGAMLLPPALALAAAVLPRAAGLWAPTDWLAPLNPPAAVGELTAPALAGFVYAGWIVLNVVLQAGASLRLGRLLKHASAVRGPAVVGVYTQLVKSMRLANPPRLVYSDEVAAPFIVASFFSGLVIVLPEAIGLRRRPGADLRAVLAHELAHARAGDPWVHRILSLVRCVLPLTWLCALVAGQLNWEDAAEQTGDLRAIRGSGLSREEYATVLKDLALGDQPETPAGTLAFSPGGAELSPDASRLMGRLRGRLRGLRLAARWSEGWSCILGPTLRALLLGGLLMYLLGHSQLRELLQDPRAAAPAQAILPAPYRGSEMHKVYKHPKADRLDSTDNKKGEDKLRKKDEKRPKKEKRVDDLLY